MVLGDRESSGLVATDTGDQAGVPGGARMEARPEPARSRDRQGTARLPGVQEAGMAQRLRAGYKQGLGQMGQKGPPGGGPGSLGLSSFIFNNLTAYGPKTKLSSY